MNVKDDMELVIRRVMADIFDIDAGAIEDDTSAENTLRWDSANHIHLVLALESEFGVCFDVAEFEAMLSFADIVQIVQAKL